MNNEKLDTDPVIERFGYASLSIQINTQGCRRSGLVNADSICEYRQLIPGPEYIIMTRHIFRTQQLSSHHQWDRYGTGTYSHIKKTESKSIWRQISTFSSEWALQDLKLLVTETAVRTSVANPACLSWIPDPELFPSRIPNLESKNWQYSHQCHKTGTLKRFWYNVKEFK